MSWLLPAPLRLLGELLSPPRERSPSPPPRPATPTFVSCWRKMPWHEHESLKTEIVNYSTGIESIPEANIVLFGLVGSGKSSFFNSIDSIFKGRFAARGETGVSGHSVTKEFRKYRIRGRNGPKFRLCDTMGMEEDQGLDVVDMPYVLDGNIPDKFQFNVGSHVTPDSPGFVRNPTHADRMHCLCYVMDACNVRMNSGETLAKIKKLKSLASARGIRFMILLTKIDVLCEEVAEDKKQAYESYAVDKVVKEVSSLTGTPIGFIYLIKNYASEQELDPATDVLCLKALQQALRFCDDILEDYDDD